MDLLVAWVVFPAVLAIVCLGCGLLVERLAGASLPGAILFPLGLCAIVVAGDFTTATSATAELTTPVAVALAIAGFVFGRGRSMLRPERWTAIAAIATFAIFAIPIVASGAATFAGYIKLDDTATWFAFTDRIMEHGRDLSGLQPSTYEAALAFNLGNGYPIGSFIPLGVGRELVGWDVAWVFQPYLALLGAFVALGLTALVRPVVATAGRAALAAFLAAQPALLFGYYLWGGIKELSTAAILVVVAYLVPAVARTEAASGRLLLPLAVSCAALVGMLSLGGAIWLVPLLVLGLLVAWRAVGLRFAWRRAFAVALVVVLLSIPVVTVGRILPPTSSPLTSSAALGNLFHPLDGFQIAGIWPVGDFRVSPGGATEIVAWVLIGALIAAAAYGAWRAWRAGAVGLLLFGVGVAAGGFVIFAIGSPWVGAKALAIASVCLPALAATGALALRMRAGVARIAGAVLVVAIAAGILWSNALAYRSVNLAPRAQLAELQTIGGLIAGEGPTLMTEYQPYGVRHFLRDAAPEGASELRRRTDPLLSGTTLPKGGYADTDRFQLDAIKQYRTLVLRRSPAQSRPPSPYRLIWRGHFYEVWQRPAGAIGTITDHLGLGTAVEPGGIPRCSDVERLAKTAGPGGTLLAVPREAVAAYPLASFSHPRAWKPFAGGSMLIPDGAGSVSGRIRLAHAGYYTVWLGGSVRSTADLLVDGKVVNSVRDQLNNRGQYVELAATHLAAGAHDIEIRFGGPSLAPGSAGTAAPVGPLAFSSQDTADTRIVRVPSSSAHDLCGRRLDWIEAEPTATVGP